MARDTSGDKNADVERAIWHATQAANLAEGEKNQAVQAQAFAVAALAYKQRIQGDAVENRELAIRYFQTALALDEPGSVSWGNAHYNLGNVYKGRRRGDRRDNLKRARRHHEEALSCRSREQQPELWSRSQFSLGNICRELADCATPPDGKLLEEAEAFYHASLEVISPTRLPRDWAITMSELGEVWVSRQKLAALDARQQALAHYRRALEVFTLEAYPRDAERVWQQIGTLTFFARDWPAALEAYQHTAALRNLLFAESYSIAGRFHELEALGPYGARQAYCLARLGRFGEAITALEQGRAHLLSAALGVRDESLARLSEQAAALVAAARNTVVTLEAEELRQEQGDPGGPKRPLWRIHANLKEAHARLARARHECLTAGSETGNPAPDLAAILALPRQGEVLLLPVFTELGSLVFALPGGVEAVGAEHVVWLDDFTLNDLRGLLGSWPYSGDRPGWFDMLMHIQSQKGQADEETIRLINDVLTRFQAGVIEHLKPTVGKQDPRRLLIVPQGGSQLLPWHAAWRSSPSGANAEVETCYLPSAGLRIRATGKETNWQASVALAADPNEDLVYAQREAEAVAQLLKLAPQQVLLGKGASREEIYRLVATRTSFHFAGHCVQNPIEPLKSALLCADGHLTFEEIRRAGSARGLRLVVLSACDSGVPEVHRMPEEALGLPTAFMMDGARTVISTLWIVDDISTSLLMREFYRILTQEAADEVTALAGAQRWLASASAKQLGLAELYRQAYERSGRKDRAAAHNAHYFRRHPDETPFADPYYWAPFIVQRLPATC